jgi:putative ABC transport system permease protein
VIQNFFSLAFRKLARHRDYTFLNVLGLALSVGCSILIFVVLNHHAHFDTYHKNAARTMRIVMDIKTETVFPFSGTPLPMAEALRNECPFVEKAAMRKDQDEVMISIAKADGGKDKYKEEETFAWVESSFFDILDLPFLLGNASSLDEPNTVALSEELAGKYFGTIEGAIGKTIQLDNTIDLRVVGVLKNLPKNTDYKQELLASWATLKSNPKLAGDLTSWEGASGGNFCFALLKKGHSFGEMDAVMASFRENHPHPEAKELFNYKALPMIGMHFDMDYGAGIDSKNLWALGMIGLFLILTACVNFVNMATAQALSCGREVGVRKSLGSTRGQLFWQSMSETALIVGISLIVGFILSRLGLPYLNHWIKEDLAFDDSVMGILVVFTIILGIVLTFLAGFYPGILQSRFNPINALRGNGELPGKGRFSIRRVLVTTQFIISQILIIGAAVITSQMRFAQDADWGYRPGAILTLEIPDPGNKHTLQRNLAQISGVKNVSLCYQPPASSSNDFTGVTFDNRPKPEEWIANNKPADANYLETFGMTLVAGRNLLPADTVREYMVNETFVKKLGFASPMEVLDKKLSLGTIKGTIVGVVRDFHNWSIQEEIAPIAFSTYSENYVTCAVHLAPGNPTQTLAKIKAEWEQLYPEFYYSQQFMDERLGEFMEMETMLLRLVNTFAVIAILIGCLGLYGLAAFMVTRKRKEVGIRKALGATISNVLWLFGKEYFRLIFLAFVIAAPIAWFAMNNWLQGYAYRITIGAGVFIISLLITVGIAVLTVGFQSVKAALANPVKSLRSE